MGLVPIGACSPGELVEYAADGRQGTGYVVGIAGRYAIQPLTDGSRAGLDRRAVWLDGEALVRRAPLH